MEKRKYTHICPHTIYGTLTFSFCVGPVMAVQSLDSSWEEIFAWMYRVVTFSSENHECFWRQIPWFHPVSSSQSSLYLLPSKFIQTLTTFFGKKTGSFVSEGENLPRLMLWKTSWKRVLHCWFSMEGGGLIFFFGSRSEVVEMSPLPAFHGIYLERSLLLGIRVP